MFGLFKDPKPAPDIDTVSSVLEQVYSMLSIATSKQQVVVKFDDPSADTVFYARINGRMWQHTDNPMPELMELHRIILLNIRQQNHISVYLD